MSRARDIADLSSVSARLDTVGGSEGALSNRNLVINGAMNVAQRGTSADTASDGDYTCDRWRVFLAGTDGNLDWDQETSSTPDGFAHALKLSMDASETSLDAGDYVGLQQRFEGQDFQHLQKGTSGAKKLVLSFWVRSSVASTYTVELEDSDNTRVICKTYTIDTADTWEYKTVIFEGDTTGTITNDANVSLSVNYWLDAGSTFTSGTLATSWESTTNANRIHDTTGWLESTSPTFYITGVQLEVGDTATDFEHRSYDDEFQRCQRYFQIWGEDSGPHTLGAGIWYSGDQILGSMVYNKTMRASPTCTVNATDWGQCYGVGSSTNTNDSTPVDVVRTDRLRFNLQAASSGTNGQATVIQIRSGTEKYLKLDAEL